MNEEHYEGSKEKVYSVKGRGDTFESILARRLQRRSLLAGAAAAVGAIVVNNSFAAAQDASPVASPELRQWRLQSVWRILSALRLSRRPMA